MLHDRRIEPTVPGASAVAALFVNAFDRDLPRVALPRPEIHLVARFGPETQDGPDVHVLGVGERVRRKLIRRGQRMVMARLRLGAHAEVLTVPATAVAGRVVALDALWGDAAVRRLRECLASARNLTEAANVLERAIADRATRFEDHDAIRANLVRAAAARLPSAPVASVAEALAVSERHLRRVFRETVGVGPKTFARLARFHRAVSAASATNDASWARIAADAGYFDQAHLIAEFRAIAGVTPRALLRELRGR